MSRRKQAGPRVCDMGSRRSGNPSWSAVRASSCADPCRTRADQPDLAKFPVSKSRQIGCHRGRDGIWRCYDRDSLASLLRLAGDVGVPIELIEDEGDA